MKKKIMIALVSFALLWFGKSAAWAMDALCNTYEPSWVGFDPFSTAGDIIYPTTYPSGFGTTNLAVFWAQPGDAFVNCYTNCGSFVANSVFLGYTPTIDSFYMTVKPLTGATNGIVYFTNLTTTGNGVCFLPSGEFIIGGAFQRPGGYASSLNIAQVSAEGVIQEIVFQVVDGVVTNLTYDATTGYVLVQGTFTEVRDSPNGTTTGLDGATGVYWEPATEEWDVRMGGGPR